MHLDESRDSETPTISEVWRMVRRLDAQINGNGQPGLVQVVTENVTWQKVRDEERKIYEARLEKKQDEAKAEAASVKREQRWLIGVVISLLGLFLTLYGIERAKGHAFFSLEKSDTQSARYTAGVPQ